MIEVKGRTCSKAIGICPRRPAKSFREDGYFITGDLGLSWRRWPHLHCRPRQGPHHFGGLNVYPKEVENELDAIEGITESAVIGVPHPDFGESVVAVVTGNPPPEPE
jgi:malonyl-CoA/methylmalonyl-CoA synthetase